LVHQSNLHVWLSSWKATADVMVSERVSSFQVHNSAEMGLSA
jgi:hypothetical protein